MMQPLNKNVIMDIQSKERRFEMSSGFSSKEPLHLALKKFENQQKMSHHFSGKIEMMIFGAKIQIF